MQAENWLILTDYSSKYRVSVSTLRRRIKAGQVRHRLENGKYFLLDAELPETDDFLEPFESPRSKISSLVSTAAAAFHPRASESGVALGALVGISATPSLERVRELESDALLTSRTPTSATEGGILTQATRLVTELKRAYMSVLFEKEEQLIHLKEEVSDLKTLVRVLEDDNERLRGLRPPR